MIYNRVLFDLYIKSFDPGTGFKGGKARKAFLSDIRGAFEERGFAIDWVNGWPAAVKEKQSLILSPYGLHGIVTPGTCRELQAGCFDRNSFLVDQEGHIYERYTTLTREQYKSYLDGTREETRAAILKALTVPKERGQEKFTDASQRLLALVREMDVMHLETRELYREETARFVFGQFQELLRAGFIISTEAHGIPLYRSLTKGELAAAQEVQEAQEGHQPILGQS